MPERNHISRQPPIEHIVWDWNGTLLDDVQASVNTINAMLDARGLPRIDIRRYRETFGFPVRDFYRAIGFQLDGEDWDAMAVDFHRRFLQDKTLRLRDAAREALQQFSDAGLGQSVLSAAEQGILDTMLRDFGITRHFRHIRGVANMHGVSKLDMGAALLRDLARPAHSVLIVGDSLHDFEVASSLGTHCLLVAHGHQARARLEATGAKIVSGLAELDIAAILRYGVVPG